MMRPAPQKVKQTAELADVRFWTKPSDMGLLAERYPVS